MGMAVSRGGLPDGAQRNRVRCLTESQILPAGNSNDHNGNEH